MVEQYRYVLSITCSQILEGYFVIFAIPLKSAALDTGSLGLIYYLIQF